SSFGYRRAEGADKVHPTIDDVIRCAAESCRSFAAFSDAFFNFARRSGWLGWENWLTVEIARRLNSRLVLPFFPYPATGEKLDLYVDAPVDLAVEVKINYITDREARQNPRPMSGRVLADAEKIAGLADRTSKLLLVSTCFESDRGRAAYAACVALDLQTRFGQFQPQWHDCSCGSGYNLLLSLLARGCR
ncbi:MAG TPA: hypothetical protein VKD71_14580, partial [Gemmataceae bacterium]|nr:hypothetical protein [Gemmataceae bacterium]